jgi:hypothetical protein
MKMATMSRNDLPKMFPRKVSWVENLPLLISLLVQHMEIIRVVLPNKVRVQVKAAPTPTLVTTVTLARTYYSISMITMTTRKKNSTMHSKNVLQIPQTTGITTIPSPIIILIIPTNPIKDLDFLHSNQPSRPIPTVMPIPTMPVPMQVTINQNQIQTEAPYDSPEKPRIPINQNPTFDSTSVLILDWETETTVTEIPIPILNPTIPLKDKRQQGRLKHPNRLKSRNIL